MSKARWVRHATLGILGIRDLAHVLKTRPRYRIMVWYTFDSMQNVQTQRCAALLKIKNHFVDKFLVIELDPCHWLGLFVFFVFETLEILDIIYFHLSFYVI